MVSPLIIEEYYILEYQPDHERAVDGGWVYLQNLVMEKHLGRKLYPDEEVKHLNGNPHDNRIENLRVIRPKFGSDYAAPSYFASSNEAKMLSKTFVPCRFQKPCWKTIRSPIAKANHVYLPYICDFQSSGQVFECSRFWKFREDEMKESGQIELSTNRTK